MRKWAADDDKVAPDRGFRSIHPLGSIGAAGARNGVHVQRVARLVRVRDRVRARVRVRVRWPPPKPTPTPNPNLDDIGLVGHTGERRHLVRGRTRGVGIGLGLGMGWG